jgi:hypothetical protein
MPAGSKIADATSPNTGPYEAPSVEGSGEGALPGVELGARPSSNNGTFENGVASIGNYPHSPADPELGGPPLASPATQATAAGQQK